jgi:hypothetical protein
MKNVGIAKEQPGKKEERVKEPEKKRKKERHTITKPPNTGIAYTII